MNNRYRRTLLAAGAAAGLYVGVWAVAAPQSFFDSFPGFGLHWVSLASRMDEHLIRDVGGLYVALSVISVAAFFAADAGPGRLAGLGWTVFGIIHLGYHVGHLTGTVVDRVGQVVALGAVTVLGVLLLPPARAGRQTGITKDHAAHTPRE